MKPLLACNKFFGTIFTFDNGIFIDSVDLRPAGDSLLNPSLRKTKHYLRHRAHTQVVPIDVYMYFHYTPKRTK